MRPAPRTLLCGLIVNLILAIPGVSIADDAASRQLVEKSIEKMWGDKFEKTKAMTTKMKGTIHLNGADIPFTGDVSGQGYDQQRLSVSLTIDGQTIAFASVLNRDQGWLKINDNTADMPEDKLKETKEQAYAGWVSSLLPLKDKAFQLAPFGEIDIGGRKAVGVGVTREGHRSITLFFDKETSYLVRTETVVRNDDGQEVTEETTYSDFKAFDGVQNPTKATIKRNGQPHVDAEIEEFKAFEKLDDSNFARP